MKRLVYSLIILFVAFGTYAQDLTDALRYSNFKINGTARSAAMGNAFGALGGDFTSLGINPAGAAVYRSGEFTITPSFGKTGIDGTFLGNTVNDSKYNVNLNNIGYVANFKTGENSESGLVSISFGLGMNKLGSFSLNSLAEGANSNHSILTYFTDYVNENGISSGEFDPYYEKLAWDTDLLLFDENNKEFFNDITDNGHGQSQRKSVDQRGYINEYVISAAANFNHKFYVGATIGIQNVTFRQDANLYEWDEKNNIPYFNDLNFKTYLKTTGDGYNFKIGGIYKPVDQIRLGIAFHTPTFYRFNDVYDSEMKSSITYDDGVTERSTAYPSKEGVYDYELETPMRTILSGAFVIGKSGLVSVDYEIVDYSSAKLKKGSDGYNYVNENSVISDAYKTTGNLHIGAEYRVNRVFSLRAGYENYPSVYTKEYLNEKNLNSSSSYSTIAGGFGFRQGNFFFDGTIKRVMDEEYLKLYPGSINMAKYSTTQNNVIFTLGYKF
jgi:hypothetical protein